MTQPVTKEALLAGLRDIHLPGVGSGQTAEDLIGALWIAALGLLIFAMVLQGLSSRRMGQRRPSLQDRVAALQSVPEGQRRVALLKLLKAHQAQRFESLRPKLYRPESTLSCDEIEAELLGD